MTLTDSNTEAPTCTVCGRDVGAGYYDSRAEQYYCDDACFNDWADANFEEVAEFYRRMNLE